MAGQKSGKAPGQTPYEPGGAEVWSDSNHDYFNDTLFNREGSLNQIHQRDRDRDQLDKIKQDARRQRNADTVDSINAGSENANKYTPSTDAPKFAGGGRVKSFGFAKGGAANFGKSYSK